MINLCSVAKVFTAITDWELLLDIPIIMVNLEKASANINRAGKCHPGCCLKSLRVYLVEIHSGILSMYTLILILKTLCAMVHV
jgi:hypothetical protein